MANCKDDGHIFGERGVCVFCKTPKPMNDESNALRDAFEKFAHSQGSPHWDTRTLLDEGCAVYISEKTQGAWVVWKHLSAEIKRLNDWADGFSDAQLKERQTGEEYKRELRAQIESLTREKGQAVVDTAVHYEKCITAIKDLHEVEISTMRTELDALAREKERRDELIDIDTATIRNLRAELDAAKEASSRHRDENITLRRDAERYRHLRIMGNMFRVYIDNEKLESLWEHTLDEAVDADIDHDTAPARPAVQPSNAFSGKVTDAMVEHVGKGLYIYWDDVNKKRRETYSPKVRKVLETMPDNKCVELVWPQWPHMSFVEDCPKCHGDGIVYLESRVSQNPCPCGRYDPPKYRELAASDDGDNEGERK